MTTSGAIAVAVMSIVFYVCGGLCIFKTKMLVAWAQRSYAKSKFVQSYPFSNMVTKPWYPVYIRCSGVFIWFWALAIDYLVIFRGFHYPEEIIMTHHLRSTHVDPLTLTALSALPYTEKVLRVDAPHLRESPGT